MSAPLDPFLSPWFPQQPFHRLRRPDLEERHEQGVDGQLSWKDSEAENDGI